MYIFAIFIQLMRCLYSDIYLLNSWWAGFINPHYIIITFQTHCDPVRSDWWQVFVPSLLPCHSEPSEPSPGLSLNQSLRVFDLPFRVKIVILNYYNTVHIQIPVYFITIFSMKKYVESYIFMEILEKNRFFLKNEESRDKTAKPDSVQSLIICCYIVGCREKNFQEKQMLLYKLHWKYETFYSCRAYVEYCL